MMPYVLLIGASFLADSETVSRFPKIKLDSIDEVNYSFEGYTSRSTSAIYVRMKNGDSVNILYDKEARLRPMAFTVSKEKAWLTDYICEGSEDNCSEILCSLPHGICKNAKIIGDSGYTFSSLSRSVAGGAELTNWKKFTYEKIPGKKRRIRNYATKYMTELPK